MNEDGMTTSAVEIVDRPLGIKKKDKYKQFDVPSDIFRRFDTGRNKFERWSKYLNLEDCDQRKIYDYALRNRKNIIILRDQTTGALRSIRQRCCCESFADFCNR